MSQVGHHPRSRATSHPDVRGNHPVRPGELWELVVDHERDVHPLLPAHAHTTLFTFKGKSLCTTSLKTPRCDNLSTTSSFLLLPPSPQPSGRSTRLACKPWRSTCGPPSLLEISPALRKSVVWPRSATCWTTWEYIDRHWTSCFLRSSAGCLNSVRVDHFPSSSRKYTSAQRRVS